MGIATSFGMVGRFFISSVHRMRIAVRESRRLLQVTLLKNRNVKLGAKVDHLFYVNKSVDTNVLGLIHIAKQ
jgi:hypothetical protein